MRVWWGQEPLAPTAPSCSPFTSASPQEASGADLALAAAPPQGSLSLSPRPSPHVDGPAAGRTVLSHGGGLTGWGHPSPQGPRLHLACCQKRCKAPSAISGEAFLLIPSQPPCKGHSPFLPLHSSMKLRQVILHLDFNLLLKKKQKAASRKSPSPSGQSHALVQRGQDSGACIRTLPPTSCVTSKKSLQLSEPGGV